MKQTIFTFLLLSVISFMSCRKDFNNQPGITVYDESQIATYIAANHITGMIEDKIDTDATGADTTHMWYKIISPGVTTGSAYQYSDKIAFVYTLQSFDGKYISSDTINNHFYDYVGHIQNDNLPVGLQIAVHNFLKYPGASMRLLIPSHLAYGAAGSGSGSSTIANNKILGNQCLDYYVHAIAVVPATNPNFAIPFTSDLKYDSLVIAHYMQDSSLTGYVRTTTKITIPNPNNPAVLIVHPFLYYYKVLNPVTVTDSITPYSVITANYVGQLLNNTVFDGNNVGTTVATLDLSTLIPGVADALEHHCGVGSRISLLIPSSDGYGLASQTGIPTFSCLRFDFNIVTVSP